MPFTPDEHAALWDAVRDAGANWRPGPNAMTMLEPEERLQRLGYTPGPGELSLQERETKAVEAVQEMRAMAVTPSAVDWRHHNGDNFVDGVKDQKNCGACVAFGTAATMESRARIIQGIPVNAPLGAVLPDLSEAHLYYCGNTTTRDPCGDGWWPSAALAFATNTGVVPLFCFPYTPGNQPCAPCAGWQQQVTKVATSTTLTSIQSIKDWIADKGPLITCFTVYADFYAYTGGVYVHTTGDAVGGHCV